MNTVTLLQNCTCGASHLGFCCVCGEERSQIWLPTLSAPDVGKWHAFLPEWFVKGASMAPSIPALDSCRDSFHHLCIAVLCVCPHLISWLTKAKCRSVSCPRFLSLVKKSVASKLIRNECVAGHVPFEKDTENKQYFPWFVLAILHCFTHFPQMAFGFH